MSIRNISAEGGFGALLGDGTSRGDMLFRFLPRQHNFENALQNEVE